MKDFYLALKARIQAGQYTMAEIVAELEKRLGQGRLTDEEHVELLALADESIDPTYDGNKMPTSYDKEQDVIMLDMDMALVELLEMVVGIASVQTSTQRSKMAISMPTTRSLADSYVRLIIADRKKFSDVQPSYKAEVAAKLIALGREDLITEAEYLPHKPEVLPTE